MNTNTLTFCGQVYVCICISLGMHHGSRADLNQSRDTPSFFKLLLFESGAVIGLRFARACTCVHTGKEPVVKYGLNSSNRPASRKY